MRQSFQGPSLPWRRSLPLDGGGRQRPLSLPKAMPFVFFGDSEVQPDNMVEGGIVEVGMKELDGKAIISRAEPPSTTKPSSRQWRAAMISFSFEGQNLVPSSAVVSSPSEGHALIFFSNSEVQTDNMVEGGIMEVGGMKELDAETIISRAEPPSAMKPSSRQWRAAAISFSSKGRTHVPSSAAVSSAYEGRALIFFSNSEVHGHGAGRLHGGDR